eukprot:scaffold2131_cov113-Isochrysis_galbana.AAC.11
MSAHQPDLRMSATVAYREPAMHEARSTRKKLKTNIRYLRDPNLGGMPELQGSPCIEYRLASSGVCLAGAENTQLQPNREHRQGGDRTRGGWALLVWGRSVLGAGFPAPTSRSRSRAR